MAGGIDWFRWHHGSVTDPKFAVVAKKSGARLGDVIALWAYLLEHASSATDRGNPGQLDDEAVELMLDLPDGQCSRIIHAMRQRGLLDGERISAWEKRQPKREDETAAERKRRQREREHELKMAQSVTDQASRNVTQCHDEKSNIHAASRNVTRRHDRGEERRGDIGTQPLVAKDQNQGAQTGARGVEIADPPKATPYGLACKAMKAAGVSDVNPAHPKLRALVDGGITADELQAAARESVAKGKGFAYALATAEGRRRDAAVIGPMPARAPQAAGDTPHALRQLEQAQALAPGAARRSPAVPLQSVVIDIEEARHVVAIEGR
jgi:hypothetical protein